MKSRNGESTSDLNRDLLFKEKAKFDDIFVSLDEQINWLVEFHFYPLPQKTCTIF
jgi:hypothetical protein